MNLFSKIVFFSIFVDVDECTRFQPCFNNATCLNINGSYSCNCMLGWEGHDCEKGKKKKGEIIRFISKRLNIFFIYFNKGYAITCMNK